MDEEEVQGITAAGMLFLVLFVVSLLFGIFGNMWFAAQMFFLMFAVFLGLALLVAGWVGFYWTAGKLIDFVSKKLDERAEKNDS